MGGLTRGAIPVWLVLLARGCGGNVELSASANGGSAAAGFDAGAGAGGAGADAGSPTEAGPDSSTEADKLWPWVCKNPDGPWGPYMSCCNGHVCLGSCENGSCDCGGIGGGCLPPSVCCKPSESGPVLCNGSPICLSTK